MINLVTAVFLIVEALIVFKTVDGGDPRIQPNGCPYGWNYFDNVTTFDGSSQGRCVTYLNQKKYFTPGLF